MSQLRALLPLPVAPPTNGVLSPVSTGPGSLRQASSAELVGESPRRIRRARRRMWPVYVVDTSVCNLPVFTLQDPSDVQGAVVYDCRPPLLPVSLDLSGIGPLSGLSTVVKASVVVPPREDGLTISVGGGGGSSELVVPEIGVAPLEDELPTPDGSPSTDAAPPEVGPVPQGVDLELVRALLEVGVLPSMVTPIVDPVVEPAVTPALYPVPPIPVLAVADPVPLTGGWEPGSGSVPVSPGVTS